MAVSAKEKFGPLLKVEEKREFKYYCGVSKVLKRFSVLANASESDWNNPSAERTHFELPNASIYVIDLHGEQGIKPECRGAFQIVLYGQVTMWAAGSDEQRAEWLQAMLASGATLKVPALADWMSKKGRWNTSFKRRYFRTEKAVGQDSLCYYESLHKAKPNGVLPLSSYSEVLQKTPNELNVTPVPKARTYILHTDSPDATKRWALRLPLIMSGAAPPERAFKDYFEAEQYMNLLSGKTPAAPAAAAAAAGAAPAAAAKPPGAAPAAAAGAGAGAAAAAAPKPVAAAAAPAATAAPAAATQPAPTNGTAAAAAPAAPAPMKASQQPTFAQPDQVPSVLTKKQDEKNAVAAATAAATAAQAAAVAAVAAAEAATEAANAANPHKKKQHLRGATVTSLAFLTSKETKVADDIPPPPPEEVAAPPPPPPAFGQDIGVDPAKDAKYKSDALKYRTFGGTGANALYDPSAVNGVSGGATAEAYPIVDALPMLSSRASVYRGSVAVGASPAAASGSGTGSGEHFPTNDKLDRLVSAHLAGGALARTHAHEQAAMASATSHGAAAGLMGAAKPLGAKEKSERLRKRIYELASGEPDLADPDALEQVLYHLLNSDSELALAGAANADQKVAALAKAAGARDHGDWNEEFQLLSERPLVLPDDDVAARAETQRLLLAFERSARMLVKVIVNERGAGDADKLLPPLEPAGTTFVHGKLLVKFASAPAVGSSTYMEDISYAKKVLGHELKSIHVLNELIGTSMRTPNVHVPGCTAVIDYGGHRALVTSVLPIKPETLVLGSNDGAVTVKNDLPDLGAWATRAGKLLNLKPHVSGNNSTTISLSADVEGHLGRDARVYVTHTARLFPPLGRIFKHEPQGAVLYRLLRPEFVTKYSTPLSPDAFTRYGVSGGSANNAEVMEATEVLVTKVIPYFVATFRGHFVPLLQSGALTIEGLGKAFDVKTEMHKYGINLRFLGHVFAGLADVPVLSDFVLIELVSRCFKHMYFGAVSNANSQYARELLTARFFTVALGASSVQPPIEPPKSADAAHAQAAEASAAIVAGGVNVDNMWRRSLPRALLQRFDFVCALMASAAEAQAALSQLAAAGEDGPDSAARRASVYSPKLMFAKAMADALGSGSSGNSGAAAAGAAPDLNLNDPAGALLGGGAMATPVKQKPMTAVPAVPFTSLPAMLRDSGVPLPFPSVEEIHRRLVLDARTRAVFFNRLQTLLCVQFKGDVKAEATAAADGGAAAAAGAAAAQGLPQFRVADIAQLKARSKSIKLAITRPGAGTASATDEKVGDRYKRLTEYYKSEIKQRSTRQSEGKATTAADRGITGLLFYLARLIDATTSAQSAPGAAAAQPGMPTAAEAHSYFSAVIKRLELKKPDDAAWLREATLVASRHFFEHFQPDSAWKLLRQSMELAQDVKAIGNFDVDFVNLTYALSVTNDMSARSLRDEKYDQVLSLFERDRDLLLSFDLPNPFEEECKKLWSAQQLFIDSAGGTAKAGTTLLPDKFELSIVWDNKAARRVKEFGVKSADRYYQFVTATAARRTADATALNAVEMEPFVPTSAQPFTKTTARARYARYVRFVCDLHVRAALAASRTKQLAKAREYAQVACAMMIQMEAIDIIASSNALKPGAAADEYLNIRYAPVLAGHYRTLAQLFPGSVDVDVAAQLLLKAYGLTCAALGKDHPSYAFVVKDLGVVFNRIGAYEHAQLLFEHAAPLFMTRFGPTHVQGTVSNAHELARCLRLQNQSGHNFARLRFDDLVMLCEHNKLTPLWTILAEAQETAIAARAWEEFGTLSAKGAKLGAAILGPQHPKTLSFAETSRTHEALLKQRATDPMKVQKALETLTPATTPQLLELFYNVKIENTQFSLDRLCVAPRLFGAAGAAQAEVEAKEKAAKEAAAQALLKAKADADAAHAAAQAAAAKAKADDEARAKAEADAKAKADAAARERAAQAEAAAEAEKAAQAAMAAAAAAVPVAFKRPNRMSIVGSFAPGATPASPTNGVGAGSTPASPTIAVPPGAAAAPAAAAPVAALAPTPAPAPEPTALPIDSEEAPVAPVAAAPAPAAAAEPAPAPAAAPEPAPAAVVEPAPVASAAVPEPAPAAVAPAAAAAAPAIVTDLPALAAAATASNPVTPAGGSAPVSGGSAASTPNGAAAAAGKPFVLPNKPLFAKLNLPAMSSFKKPSAPAGSLAGLFGPPDAAAAGGAAKPADAPANPPPSS